MNSYEYSIRFPDLSDLPQGDEFFFLKANGKEKKLKLHDYEEIYKYPMLYEKVLYELLKCNTPHAICNLFSDALTKSSVNPNDLNVLEIGAGSGIFGEYLKNMGINSLAGLDIYEVAKEAAMRDRPGLYRDYYIADLTKLPKEICTEIKDKQYNCVAVASATGWGNHIPVIGFEAAFNLLVEGGWFVYHVKRDEEDPDCLELCEWIDKLIAKNELQLKEKESCFHRYSIDNKPIYYDVIIGTKI